jgi:probable phosphoglycerate mutase
VKELECIKLYLIRHAGQESPLCNVNVPLADEGLLQSKLVGQRLREYNIDRVYSSNLIRARMTADIIREQLGMSSNINKSNSSINYEYELEDLRETDFGYMTGLSDKVIKEQFSDYFIQRELMKEDISIPGGENGEQVFQRMNRAIENIIKRSRDNRDKNIVIVTHGGAIRCYLAGILGMPFGKRFAIAKTMENCSITQVDYNIENDNYTVERINDYSHLEGYDELLRKNFAR